MSAYTNTELFGDDSSDSDSPNNPPAPPSTAPSTAPAAKKTSELDKVSADLGLSSDSDDDNTTSLSAAVAADTASTAAITGDRPLTDLPQPPTHTTKAKDLRLLPIQPILGNAKNSRKDPKLFISKIPNFMGIVQEEYDIDTWTAQEEKEKYKFTSSLVRWRHKTAPATAGSDVLKKVVTGALSGRESNTNIVKWSDGSMQLLVGKEVFDLDGVDLPTSFVYAHNVDREEDGTEGETVLEGVGALKKKLIPTPTSLDSMAHKVLTAQIRKRNIKQAKIKQVVTEKDPEKVAEDRARDQDDLHRAVKRKKKAGANGRNGVGMTASYLEDDDTMYDDVVAPRTRSAAGGEEDVSSEEDEWDERGVHTRKSGGTQDSTDPFANSDSENDEFETGTNSATAATKKALVDSDSD